MSKPKKINAKNQDLESAVKADSEALKTEGSGKNKKEAKESPKKPFDEMKAEINKLDPVSQICSDVKDADFEGTIEFTEEDLNALTPSGDGRNIFEFYQLDAPEEEFEDWVHMLLPIANNELAIKHNVFVMLLVPYLFKIPFSEVTTDPRVNADLPCIVLGDIFLGVTQKTLEEYAKALKYIGLDGGITQIDQDCDAIEELRKMVAMAQVRDNGYYEDLMEYWYAGHLFHEKDVIWVELESMAKDSEDDGSAEEGQVVGRRKIGDPAVFVLNFDVLGGFHYPVDISDVKNVKVENSRRVLSKRELGEAKFYGYNLEFLTTLTPAEEVWYLATEKAKSEDSAGFAVVCLGGKFCVPVETSINFYTHEVEEYISLFNVTSCYTNHHNCIGLIIIDVGNMQVNTGVRYLKGRHFDWKKRINQELKAYRLGNPDYDPYADPYDDPMNAYDFGSDGL